MEADTFGGIGDTQHGDALAGDETFPTQGLDGEAATVMLGNHAEAGGTAVHGVELAEGGEKHIIISK
jgi:hypothetical protein